MDPSSIGMDIVRAFECAGLASGFKLNLQGTPDDPLFQASQIGELLGIVNIRASIKDFDEDEKGVDTVYTLGGKQEMLFLTELGLYRLLGMSRKPFARPFQKWVAKVVKEIRTTGKYELEARLKESNKNVLDLMSAKERERHDLLLRKYKRRNKDVAYGCTYIAKVQLLDGGIIVIKIGETDNLEERVRMLLAELKMFVLLEVFTCNRAHDFEQFVIHHKNVTPFKHTECVNNVRTGTEFFAVDDVAYASIVALMNKHVKHFDNIDPTTHLELQKLKVTERAMKIKEGVLELKKEFQKAIFNRFDAEADPTVRLALLALIAPRHPLSCPIPSPEVANHDSDSDDDLSIDLPPEPVAEVPRPFASHRPTDNMIQQYDASDLTKLVAVHNGIREAARAVPGSKSSSIRTACDTHEAYHGFRWHLIGRPAPGQEHEANQVVLDLPPTAPPCRGNGTVAQLSGGEIVAVHRDQVRAAQAVGLRAGASITNAIKNQTNAGGFKWMWYADCSKEKQDAFGPLPDMGDELHGRGKRLFQLNPISNAVVKIHRSMQAACIELQASHKQLHLAVENKTVYKNFKWESGVPNVA